MVNSAPACSADLQQDERPLLAYEEPVRTWAGHGTGEPCNVCGLAVHVHDVEYEVELLTDGSVRTLRFHLKCYRLWEMQS
jgi:hypothetical protein